MMMTGEAAEMAAGGVGAGSAGATRVYVCPAREQLFLISPAPARLIATTKDHKQRRAARELGRTSGPPPPDATPVQEMEHLLRTPQGAAAYAKRSSLIEPVFGDRKHNHGIRSFRRRGLKAAQSEWAFIHLAGNMLKLHKHRTTPAAA